MQSMTKRHDWMLRLLSDLVDYSEAEKLPAVTEALVRALEEIAPRLAGARGPGGCVLAPVLARLEARILPFPGADRGG
jgi:hypothetical protein